jgi:hypothetical protein
MQIGTRNSCGPPRRVNSVMKRSAAAGRLRGEMIESQRALSCCASATSVPCLCALCVSAFPLNFQLSTVNTAIPTQLPCFDTLAHSFEEATKSPLCFHALAHSFAEAPRRNKEQQFHFQSVAHSLAKTGGYTPSPDALSEPSLELRPLTSTASRARAPERSNMP